MTVALLCALFFALGAYVSAMAAGIGGVPLAQSVATACGLSSILVAVAVVSEYLHRERS